MTKIEERKRTTLTCGRPFPSEGSVLVSLWIFGQKQPKNDGYMRHCNTVLMNVRTQRLVWYWCCGGCTWYAWDEGEKVMPTTEKKRENRPSSHQRSTMFASDRTDVIRTYLHWRHDHHIRERGTLDWRYHLGNETGRTSMVLNLHRVYVSLRTYLWTSKIPVDVMVLNLHRSTSPCGRTCGRQNSLWTCVPKHVESYVTQPLCLRSITPISPSPEVL